MGNWLKLKEMAETTSTDFWNDSCSIDELKYAIDNGAVGATTNPVIVGNVLEREMPLWEERIASLVEEFVDGTEEDIAWRLNEEMAIKGAELLKPVFDATGGMKGRLSIQTNPMHYRNTGSLVGQSLRFHALGDNLQVKLPVTRAGVEAIEEVTAAGVNINATVSFTVPQAIAVAEAVERGLKRLGKGQDIQKMTPVCTIMVGRIDDWIKVVTDRDRICSTPGLAEWAGVAVFKRAYRIFQERGYRTRLLAAAYRNHYHWSEFIGGDVVLTIPYKWQKLFNGSDVEVVERMGREVDPSIIAELIARYPDFVKAYEPDGLTIDEFDNYGATVRTLRSFMEGYHKLLGMVREFMLPNPDR